MEMENDEIDFHIQSLMNCKGHTSIRAGEEGRWGGGGGGGRRKRTEEEEEEEETVIIPALIAT